MYLLRILALALPIVFAFACLVIGYLWPGAIFWYGIVGLIGLLVPVQLWRMDFNAFPEFEGPKGLYLAAGILSGSAVAMLSVGRVLSHQVQAQQVTALPFIMAVGSIIALTLLIEGASQSLHHH